MLIIIFNLLSISKMNKIISNLSYIFNILLFFYLIYHFIMYFSGSYGNLNQQ